MKISQIPSYRTDIKITTPGRNNIAFNGKKEKLISSTLKLGFSLPASALFIEAEKEIKDPAQIINEYYANENKYLAKNDLKVSLNRFSEEEKYEILHHAEDIKANPIGFSQIIYAKNDDSSYRFNADESIAIFLETGGNIFKHREIFKKILDAKDEDNKPRFNSNDCIILMKNSKILKTNENAFDAILHCKALSAQDCKNLILKMGDEINKRPYLIEEAMEINLNNTEKNYGKTLINTIKEIIEQEKLTPEAIARKDLEIRSTIRDEKKLLAQMKAEEAAKKLAEEKAKEKAEKKAEELRKKQAILDIYNKRAGWVDADKFFDKVYTSVNTQIPLVLENGEIIPDEMRDNIAKNIYTHPPKAKHIINARYSNLMPVFSEKEYCKVLSELDSYFYTDRISYLAKYNRNGKPLFSPEQCINLLKNKKYGLNWTLNTYLKSSGRQYSSDEIVKIIANDDVTSYFTYIDGKYVRPFIELSQEKLPDGKYKYSIEECINICRENQKD